MNQKSNPTLILGGGFRWVIYGSASEPPKLPATDRPRRTTRSLQFQATPVRTAQWRTKRSRQVYPRYADLLAESGVTFVQDTVKSIDLRRQRVALACWRKITPTARLVLALGSKVTYLNTPGAAEYALPLTSGAEAIALRERLQAQLRQAVMTARSTGTLPVTDGGDYWGGACWHRISLYSGRFIAAVVRRSGGRYRRSAGNTHQSQRRTAQRRY